MKITPLNARDLLEQALVLDGREPGEHVEALRNQFRRQVMGGYADRAQERQIRNNRPRGPAHTPRTRVRGPSHTPTLAERSDAEVLGAFDRLTAAIAKKTGSDKPSDSHKHLRIIIGELRRRGMFIEVNHEV